MRGTRSIVEVQQEWIAARSGAFCAVVAVDSAGAVLGFGFGCCVLQHLVSNKVHVNKKRVVAFRPAYTAGIAIHSLLLGRFQFGKDESSQ